MWGLETDACNPGDKRKAAAFADGSCAEGALYAGEAVRSLRVIAAEYAQRHRRRARREWG
jgi:hypothetical protein